MESSNPTFPEPRIGEIIEGYEILKPLGAGGMGRVYQVRNTLSNRVDAMKILLPDLASDPDLTARFLSEIQVLGTLSHPNIAALYTAFRVADRFAMILEYVEGEPLNVRLQAGRLAPQEALRFIGQVLEAVRYAHEKGVVHRDIKPGNIILTANGSVKLVDFGIAKSTAGPALTAVGTALGSAYYMSPEQVLGTALDSRSDLYSVGITLYEMVTGERPIRGDTDYAIMDGHLHLVPPPATERNPAVSPAVSGIIAKALAKNPAERFQTAGEFLDAIHASLAVPTGTKPADPLPTLVSPARTEPSRQSGRRWMLLSVVGVLALAVLVAAGVWFAKPKAVPAPKQPPAVASLPNSLNLPSGNMVLIPGGQALLGADRHPVNVGAFYMDTTEVSNAAYAAFCRATGAPVPADAQSHPDLPVVNVSFADAQAFARWAGKRLPKPEEWEKAARGANGQSLPWGEDLEPSHANLGGAGSSSALQPVRSHTDSASPYGVLNLIGNVWEWMDAPAVAGKAQIENLLTESWARALRPPLSPDEAFMQIRGGSYSFLTNAQPKDMAQLVYDFAILPARARRPEIGFRCAKDLSVR